jgi:hypothetical protein
MALLKIDLPKYRYIPKGSDEPARCARVRLWRTCVKLGVSAKKMGTFTLPVNPGSVFSATFKPPTFDPLLDTVDEWVTRADEAWRKHRTATAEAFQKLVAEAVEAGDIVPARRHRGPGKKRVASLSETRYEWAAWRMGKLTYRAIAAKYPGTTTKQVEMACRAVFSEAEVTPPRVK